jgi:hypothetical protein
VLVQVELLLDVVISRRREPRPHTGEHERDWPFTALGPEGIYRRHLHSATESLRIVNASQHQVCGNIASVSTGLTSLVMHWPALVGRLGVKLTEALDQPEALVGRS